MRIRGRRSRCLPLVVMLVLVVVIIAREGDYWLCRGVVILIFSDFGVPRRTTKKKVINYSMNDVHYVWNFNHFWDAHTNTHRL